MQSFSHHSDHLVHDKCTAGCMKIKLPKTITSEIFQTEFTITQRNNFFECKPENFQLLKTTTLTLQGQFVNDICRLMPTSMKNNQLVMLSIVPNGDCYTGVYVGILPYIHGAVHFKPDPVCLGCEYDEPGQLAHMEPGGCLYDLV